MLYGLDLKKRLWATVNVAASQGTQGQGMLGFRMDIYLTANIG